MMGICAEEGNVAVVMEYVQGRDLGDLISDASVSMTTEQRLKIGKDIAVSTYPPPVVLKLIASQQQAVTGYTAYPHPSFTEI